MSDTDPLQQEFHNNKRSTTNKARWEKGDIFVGMTIPAVTLAIAVEGIFANKTRQDTLAIAAYKALQNEIMFSTASEHLDRFLEEVAIRSVEETVTRVVGEVY